jgi:predicted CXXCH cytochrome family protein
LVLAVVMVGATAALAFHEGGVATCTSCHSMHEALDSGALLVKVDNSSTCLTCHEGSAGSYRVSTPTANAPAGVAPWQRNPGGDFRWLSKSYTWTMPRSGSNDGQQHGHNIVAAGADEANFSFTADLNNVMAPGGTMLSSGLGCASCHDPHGQTRRDENGDFINPGSASFVGTSYPPIEASGSYPDPYEPEPGYALGSYRLLGGEGYQAYGTTTFPGAPIAIAPSTYNRTELATQTRVAYGTPGAAGAGTASWAEWCGTCHAAYHTAPAGVFVHPVDDGLGAVADNYNKYMKTGELTATDADSYTSLVPFAENTEDWAVLASHAVNNDTILNGPTDEDRVTCLSCHRAHASAWDNILRWNQSAEFLTVADEATGDPEYAAANNEHSGEGPFHRGYSVAEMTAAYYDRDVKVAFAGYQRSLCNKCHIKD